MLIDSHVHVGDWKYFDPCGRAYSGFEEILRLLSVKGFSGAVFMPSELKSNRELLEEITRHRNSAHPFQSWFFPWFNPQRQEDLRFAEAHIQDMDGMKFHPSLDKMKFTRENHRAFLDLAAEHRLPVLVHCGAWIEMAHYLFVLDVAEDRPGINFILAHQGGTTYELKIGAAAEVRNRALENVYFDIAGTHEYWILEHCVKELGPERFLLGSDFPIVDAAIYPVVLDGARLNEEEKDRIRHKNLLGLVGRR